MKKKIKNKLPKKASDLLLVSLADLEMVENNPKYKINMRRWVERRQGVCEVCHAGAVIVGTLGASSTEGLDFIGAGNKTVEKLRSLDRFRRGHATLFNHTHGVLIEDIFECGRHRPSGLNFYEVYACSSAPVGSEEWQTYKDWIVDYAMFLKSEGY